MQKHIALGIAVIAALAVVILMFTSLVPWGANDRPVAPPTVMSPAQPQGTKHYEAPEAGLSFDYPARYMVWEDEVGTAQRGHYRIDLVEDTQENRNLRAGLSPGREGPISISFDVFQNDLDKTEILDWVKGNANSNFKLGDGTYEETTLAGVPAIFYRHSGLYEANAFVFAHKDNIIKATVTYFSPEDPIIEDFSSVLSTLELY
ncbi:MAG TPA: hypothetical protein VD967_02790 [Candidatus Paceibacterota bacterium]|nr:hypothetical protein [Candidatus Paceibacterota bacterium]